MLGTQGARSPRISSQVHRVRGIFRIFLKTEIFFSVFKKKYSSTRSVFKSFLRIPRKRSLPRRSRNVTSKKRLQGRLRKTLKRCKYDSVVASEQVLCLGKEFAPLPKDCSQVTASGLLMTASVILCTTHISKTSIRFRSSTRKTTIRRFQKYVLRGPFPKNLCFWCPPTHFFFVAFSAPDPPGGLSMRATRLWGHRI